MTIDLITPIDRKPAAERVASRLMELIQSGNLSAGDKLPHEVELASALQVSRPTVREALRGLSMLGVVETRQGEGCYVTDLKPERLIAPLSFAVSLDKYTSETLFRARAVIDPALAADAAARATEADMAKLEQFVAVGYATVKDPIAFRVMDLEFHGTINLIADNPFLMQVARALYELGIDVRRMASETAGVLDRSARDHDAIARAIRARDPAAAAQAMRDHVAHIERTTFEAMKRRPKRKRPDRA
ncbi:FadR/GntR family transcriptional regulator [Labrys wisconsinensis]|uniref:GntR family transcriptional repressor for pyruvate dehydrogenase complex n=1 Tax=Labrys wisconsinensis TaxID=425677 RepID=A0ABU0IYH1_9HYPH|nr:FCD domain-containing protein [Labrys wisconsinensis]MDQ0467059.1 GntR family transcriptional repressor for pyruvate dehydrogenase complex [Labrys wisconsinensis]